MRWRQPSRQRADHYAFFPTSNQTSFRLTSPFVRERHLSVGESPSSGPHGSHHIAPRNECQGKQQIKFAPQSGFPDCAGADIFSQFSGMNVIDESVHWNRLSVELAEVYYIVDCTTRHSW